GLAGAAPRARSAMAQGHLRRGDAHGGFAHPGAARHGPGPGPAAGDPLGHSLEHALMTQAAMQARVPAAPISPAYSLMSQDHAKLKYIFNLISPGAVLVQDGKLFAKALAALDLTGIPVIHVENPPPGIDSVPYEQLAATPVTGAVAESVAAITPDTVGKLLFT